MKDVNKRLPKDARLHPRPLILGMRLPRPALPYLHFLTLFCAQLKYPQKYQLKPPFPKVRNNGEHWGTLGNIEEQ